jgi:hypothetical protein
LGNIVHAVQPHLFEAYYWFAPAACLNESDAFGENTVIDSKLIYFPKALPHPEAFTF